MVDRADLQQDGSGAPGSSSGQLPGDAAALDRPQQQQQQRQHDATNNNHLSPSTSSTPACPPTGGDPAERGGSGSGGSGSGGSQENASQGGGRPSLIMTGQPQRPASDSSNQSTDAEQHFPGTSRPSWQHANSSRPPASDANAAPSSGDPTPTDGYHSPTRPSLKLPKRRHGHADPPPLPSHAHAHASSHHHPHPHHHALHHPHPLHAPHHPPNTSSGIESDGGCSADDAANMAEPVSKISKKQRLHWSAELHTRFMSAVHHLGIDAAVPKTILQLMNVEGMTRDNVASHLQKYRLHLKRLAGVGPNDPIPPHLIPQVQAEAMRLHKAKQQQEAFQLRMLQEHRTRNDRARADAAATANPAAPSQPLSPSAAAAPTLHHPLGLPAAAAASPASPHHHQAAPKSLFPPLVINHDAAAHQPPFHPFAQPSLGGPLPSSAAAGGKKAQAPAGQGAGQDAAAAAALSSQAAAAAAAMHGLMPQSSASMDAVQLGYTLGLMQGAHQWKGQQQYQGHMVSQTHPSLVHLAPHLQTPLFDPTAAAAAAMANTLQQQQQQHAQQLQQQHQQQQHQHQQQHQPEVSGGLSLASLAALQQMYCPLPTGPYGAAFVAVQPPGASMLPQGDAGMFGLQPGAVWPMRPVFPQPGQYPPC